MAGTDKITLEALTAMIADPDVDRDRLKPYFRADPEASGPFAPHLALNPETVDLPDGEEGRTRSALLLNGANWLARSNRQARFYQLLAKGTYKGPVIVSEGDSWFQYPILLRDTIDVLMDDLAVFSLGAGGDTLENMLRKAEYRKALRETGASILLLSGGGNDLVADGNLASHLRPFDPALGAAQYLRPSFDGVVARAVSQFDAIARDVARRFAQVQILTHGYDHVVPDKGKWLGKPMISQGITDPGLQKDIAHEMMQRFNAALGALARRHAHLHYLDMRGQVGDTRWHDELHPTDAGYRAVAAVFRTRIDKLAGTSRSAGGAQTGAGTRSATGEGKGGATGSGTGSGTVAGTGAGTVAVTGAGTGAVTGAGTGAGTGSPTGARGAGTGGPAPAIAADGPRGVSLHVGVNRADPAHYGDALPDLEFCVADARAMEGLAAAQGFEHHRLEDAAASRDAVLDAVTRAGRELKAGDIFLLTYAGHGGQIQDLNGDEPGGPDEDWLDETLCLHDGQLIDDELFHLWSRFAEGVRVVTVFDCCHSGSMLRAGDGPAGDAPERPGRARRMEPRFFGRVLRNNFGMYRDIALSLERVNTGITTRELDYPIAASVLQMSACQSNQLAMEHTDHGLFTKRLLETFEAPSPGARSGYKTFMDRISARMPDRQTPKYWTIGAPDPGFELQVPFSI